MFHCGRGVWFRNWIFPWLHFICKTLQIMDAQAALFCKCFNELPRLLQGDTTEEQKAFQEILQDVDRNEISPWQVSRAFAADVLYIIQTSVAMLLGEGLDLPEAEKMYKCTKTCLRHYKHSLQKHGSKQTTLARRLSMSRRKDKLTSHQRGRH